MHYNFILAFGWCPKSINYTFASWCEFNIMSLKVVTYITIHNNNNNNLLDYAQLRNQTQYLSETKTNK